MIGTKIYKPCETQEDLDQYSALADWCNNNGARIADMGEYYECVATQPYEPTPEEVQRQMTDAVQAWMDETVKVRGYDNVLSACTYADSLDDTFRREGTACRIWRDSVWRACYNILNEVLAGRRAVPTIDELIAELPELEW